MTATSPPRLGFADLVDYSMQGGAEDLQRLWGGGANDRGASETRPSELPMVPRKWESFHDFCNSYSWLALSPTNMAPVGRYLD